MDISRRQGTTFLLIVVYFSVLFSILVYGIQFVDKSEFKFPTLTNCLNIDTFFETSESYKHFATIDKDPTLLGHGHGIYQCFCKARSSLTDIFSSVVTGEESDFCGDYVYNMGVGKIAGYGLSIGIASFNFIIAIVNKWLIERIGYHYKSQTVK